MRAGGFDMIRYPTYSKRVTLDQLRNFRTFKGLHPDMRDRVISLIEASKGDVGLGQGLRPVTQQLQLFLSRHEPDPNGRYRHDGKRWRRLPGMAAAAPPGFSMHEVGLAADLVGDLAWVQRNASRFRLQTFANVNKEPWHVQPVELPRGRSAYNRNPAWGKPPWDASTSDPGSSSSPSMSTSREVLQLTPAFRARPGDDGAAVEVMIEALIARLPDATIERDSRYDPDDEEIVRDFQASAGVVVDGLVGPQTWGKLLKVVQPGDEGPDARVLQVTLIHRGLIRNTTANRDGVYGPATQDVIAQFQTAAGLRSDREVGPATWTALIGEKKRVRVTRGGPADDFDYDEDFDILTVVEGVAGE
ncbi:MAG: peptidoglycan-binding protein [Actinomycetota bacterium]